MIANKHARRLAGRSFLFRQYKLARTGTRALNYYHFPLVSTQARELKLPEFQLRILCEEWGKLDRDATYLLPVRQLPLLWQKVSHVSCLRPFPQRYKALSGFVRTRHSLVNPTILG